MFLQTQRISATHVQSMCEANYCKVTQNGLHSTGFTDQAGRVVGWKTVSSSFC